MMTAQVRLLGCRYERSTRGSIRAAVVRSCRVAILRSISWLGIVGALAAVPAAAAEGEQPASGRPVSIPLRLEQAVEPAAAADGQAETGTGLSPLPFDWQAWAVVVLAVVGMLGLRFFGRQRTQPLPTDVFELLGEATLGGGQPVRIVRFGPKTLLVTTGSGGPRTLAELDDPLATEWIAAACRGERTLRAVHAPAGPAAGMTGRDSTRSPTNRSLPVGQSPDPNLPLAEVA